MKQSREERLAKKRAYAKAKYYERKAARLCYECTAPLTSIDGVRCEFCHDLDAERQRVYRQKESHKRTDRKRGARRRARLRAAGLCQFCKTPSGGFASCPEHRARAVAATKAWKERKRLGITRLPAKRAPIVDPSPLLESADSEEQRSWTERVLKAMRWFDWVNSTELFDAMGLSTDPWALDHNNAAQALSRIVKRELAERRGKRNAYDYRITDAGRALIGAQRRAA